ncbi:MAG: phosphate ABC transporter ATP-binding protein [Proteocatella sp.]
MPVIKIKELKKSYDGKMVLDIPDLEIKSGKITAVIGPSGAGKSTLIAIINGLEIPDQGQIVFQGEVFSRSQKYTQKTRRKMAMVFQKPWMFNTSVYKNIAYGLKARKETSQKISEEVEETARMIGMEDKLRQNATTLSGGEAGRVSVARALIINPKLLLMDEPTASLDPQNISMIENLVKKAKEQNNTSIIIVTHNMFQAKRIADEVIFMLDGKVIEFGTTEELFAKPRDARTAQFVAGDMIY